jgi:hypothetical protein
LPTSIIDVGVAVADASTSGESATLAGAVPRGD